jgi:hypothetical protein
MGHSMTAIYGSSRIPIGASPDRDWYILHQPGTMSAQEVWLSRDNGSLVPPMQQSPQWLSEVVDDLLDWANEPAGWDSYGASRISPYAVSAAVRFLNAVALFGVSRPFVTGDSDGGVTGSWDSDRYSMQLDFHESAIDLFIWDKYADEQWEGPLNSAVDRLGPVLWYLSRCGV